MPSVGRLLLAALLGLQALASNSAADLAQMSAILTADEAPANKLEAAPVAPLEPAKPALSCYVCSTMDYPDSENNLCRSADHLSWSRSQPLRQMRIDYGPSTGQHAPGAPTTSPQAPATKYQPRPVSGLHSGLLAPTPEAGPAPAPTSGLSRNLSQAAAWPVGQVQRDRLVAASSNEFLARRACSDGENFCSIVSVVRIEITNNKIKSRFWATERNCSRSCNTGCMLIGERVRLRVCSQCCREPHCNLNSGATGLIDLRPARGLVLALALVAALGAFDLRRKCAPLT